MIRSLILFISLFSIAYPAFSTEPFFIEEESFVEILSKPENDRFYDLSLQLDETGDIVAFVFRSEGLEKVISTEELENGEILLAEVQGREALFVSCLNCDWQEGGELSVRYLYSGLDDSYRTFQMGFEKDEDLWIPFVGEEDVFNLTLSSNTIFGRVIGVKEILVNDY